MNTCIYLLGGNSSHNESLPIARRDISPIDDAMSPESGKSNNSRGRYSNSTLQFVLSSKISF